MGGSLGLALRASTGRGARRRPRSRGAARPRWRWARSPTAAGSLEEAAAGADAVVLAAPVPTARRPGRAARSPASGPTCVVTDLGSAKSGRHGGARPGGARAVHRRPPGVRRRADRRGLRPRGALPGRHLVPHARAPRPGRSSSAASTAWSRRSARGRWRSTPRVHDRLMALVSHLPHVLAGALDQPGRGHGARGARGPALGRAVVQRPDARRGVEPAAVGRHPAGQPRGGARGAARLTPRASTRWSAALERGDRDWLLGFVGDAGRGARGAASRRSDREAGAPARVRRGGAEPARARSRRSPRPSATPTSTSRTSSLRPGPPGGRGRAGAGARRPRGRARGRAPRGRAGLPGARDPLRRLPRR